MARSSKYQQRMADYKRLAKKADAQMRTLERYIRLSQMTVYETKINKKTGKKTKVISHKYEKYHVLKDYAYGTALKDIQRLYGGGKRFDRSAKGLSLADLNERIKAIEDFLSKPSAYVKASKEHESINVAWKRAADAFSAELTKRLKDSGMISDKDKISLTPEELADLMHQAEEYGVLDEFGKYEVLESVKEIQDDKSLLEAINKIRDKYPERMNEDAENAMTTEMKDELQELGVSKASSATISNMVAMGVDFSKFRRI